MVAQLLGLGYRIRSSPQQAVFMKPLAFDAIAEKRRYGSVIGGFSDVSFDRSDFENLDHASVAVDVFQIGDDWIPISRDELLTGLTRLNCVRLGI